MIVRQGAIARIRDWLGGAATEFLIDASIFPGNSGGPVLNRPEAVSITGTKSVGAWYLIRSRFKLPQLHRFGDQCADWPSARVVRGGTRLSRPSCRPATYPRGNRRFPRCAPRSRSLAARHRNRDASPGLRRGDAARWRVARSTPDRRRVTGRRTFRLWQPSVTSGRTLRWTFDHLTLSMATARASRAGRRSPCSPITSPTSRLVTSSGQPVPGLHPAPGRREPRGSPGGP